MPAVPRPGSSLGMLAVAEGIGELDKAPGGHGPISVLHHRLMMQHDYNDPPGLFEKVKWLIRKPFKCVFCVWVGTQMLFSYHYHIL